LIRLQKSFQPHSKASGSVREKVMYSTVLFLMFAIPAIAQIATEDPQYYRDNRQRIDAYVFRTYTDPTRLAWLLFDSATAHFSQDPHQWDRSAESYGYRVASGWGRRIVRNTAQLGFETALQEDSRYRRSTETGFRSRILFALSHSVLAYKPNGSVEPMYGRMAAGVVAAAISSTWHPQSTRTDTLLCGVGSSVLDRAGNNLLTEFEPDLKRFGSKTWNSLRRK
jgi:hypothetical protein